ncbi:MAG: YihY/virulence factor BrkB family protein [Lachnospiraceae bacterium]|nr:YihY/virulence factor BrkB family protein [Lachnospiraceae bacterium]
MQRMLNDVSGFLKRMDDDKVGAFASQAAFFILLSVIPFLLLLLTLIQYLPVEQDSVRNVLLQIIPSEFSGLVSGIINEVYQKSSAVVPISAIFTLWSAGKGINALTNGFNNVYHVTETRNYFIGRIRAMFYTLIFIIAIATSLVIMVFGNMIQGMLRHRAPMIAAMTESILNMRTLIMILSLIVIFLMLYKAIPNRKASFRSQIPGALISSVAWYIFSLGFSWYLELFPGFSNMYGSLTTIVLVMLWMYFCMYIIMIGAEINAYFEDQLRKLHDFTRDKIRREYRNIFSHEEEEHIAEEEEDELSSRGRTLQDRN